MAKKHKGTSPRLSSLMARVLRGYEPTREEIVSICASGLSQDQTKGQGEKPEPANPEEEARTDT